MALIVAALALVVVAVGIYRYEKPSDAIKMIKSNTVSPPEDAQFYDERIADFAVATRSHTLPEPSCATDLVLETARRLLDDVWPLIEERGLTRLGLAVSGLAADDAVQLALPFGKAQLGTIDGAIDEVRRRFGTAALKRAAVVDQDAIEMPLLPD